MDLYRAEARRIHSGRATWWQGKFRKDPKRALAHARRWREKEPSADIYVVCSNGMKATLEHMEQALKSGKPK